MAQEDFIDRLRTASRLLARPTVKSVPPNELDWELGSILDSADLWLTPKSVEGFDLADFESWPKEARERLAKEVSAFLAVAEKVPADKPASHSKSRQARKHLESVIEIVRDRLLPEWLEAQEKMISDVMAVARKHGWHVSRDEKEILESLLGVYNAPRLLIRTENNEVVLDPIARFGSGRQGVVDLVVLPTYETAYLLAFKNGAWQIISRQGASNRRPFTQAALVNSIRRLRTANAPT